MERVLNLAAGPSALPESVLSQAQAGLLDYNKTGIGITEISHRSSHFQNLLAQAESDLRLLLEIPDTFAVVFMQGGGLTQFSATVLNLIAAWKIKHKTSADPAAEYVISGSWSAKAAGEAGRMGAKVHCVVDGRNSSKDRKSFGSLAPQDQWDWSPPEDLPPALIYYCANETVNGVEIDPPVPPPHLSHVPVVADMSSNILSRPILFATTNYGVIYAGAQKNIGPAGLTVVIVRKDLLVDVDAALPYGGTRIPQMLSYKVLAEAGSLYNTPPVFAIYVAGLVFKHLRAKGGLKAITDENEQKAKLVYDTIDQSNGFYIPKVDTHLRSKMNIVFLCKGEGMDAKFISEADAVGIKQVKGHRSVGGIRTSLYNAISLQDTQRLVDFMNDFRNKQQQR